jgi:carbonic anhydrase
MLQVGIFTSSGVVPAWLVLPQILSGMRHAMPMRDALDTDYLRRGVHHFRSEVFPKKQELYESLAEKQKPDALFLTCGDSRIDPTALTSTEPGQIFVERTPGNIVPIYSDLAAVGVSASIEYSVVELGVTDIVVCGHSACGAMKGLLHPEELHLIPATARWLEYAEPALRWLNRDFPDLADPERLERLSKLNVIEQVAHLHTHPAVESRVKDGKLALHGWYYEIDTGRVEVFNLERRRFEEWL